MFKLSDYLATPQRTFRNIGKEYCPGCDGCETRPLCLTCHGTGQVSCTKCRGGRDLVDHRCVFCGYTDGEYWST